MNHHRARYTVHTRCGCLVFIRGGDAFGVALEDCAAGERVRLGRRCPLHGDTELIAIAQNGDGAGIWPLALFPDIPSS